MRHHTWLIYLFLVETEFCHVGQAALKLLTSNDLPASASPKCWDYRCKPLPLTPNLSLSSLKSHPKLDQAQAQSKPQPQVYPNSMLQPQPQPQPHSQFTPNSMSQPQPQAQTQTQVQPKVQP
ncbi:Zinc finger protein [Plecturocebus cupreus]